MTLEAPQWLALVVVLVALVAVYIAVQLARTKYTLRFTSVDLLESVAPKRAGWQRHVSAALMLLALVGLVIALAKPATTSRVPKERGTILLATALTIALVIRISSTRLRIGAGGRVSEAHDLLD